jgi:hypothetical protein
VNVLRAALIDVGGTLWPELGPPSHQQEGPFKTLLDWINNKPRGLCTLSIAGCRCGRTLPCCSRIPMPLSRRCSAKSEWANIEPRVVREAICVPAATSAYVRSS